MRPRPLFAILLCGAAALATLAGCQRDEPISKEIVEHVEREPLRLLAAVVPYKDKNWYFRLSGPADAVAAEKAAFDALLASVSFDDARDPPLTWKAPNGWKEFPGGGMRAVTFRMEPNGRPLELTVIPLDREADSSILENVNRWRKQIALPPVERRELEEVVKRAKVGGRDAVVADFSGLGTHLVAKAPEQPKGGDNPFARGKLPFTFDAPKGWKKQRPPARMSVESYEVGEADRPALVTLTVLGQGGGGIEANLKRWRDQVKLPHASVAEMMEEVQTLDLGGAKAAYVDYANPKNPAPNNRILGVVMPLEREAWFFKMTGPHDVVGRHKDEFDAFVKSVRLDVK